MKPEYNDYRFSIILKDGLFSCIGERKIKSSWSKDWEAHEKYQDFDLAWLALKRHAFGLGFTD